MIPQDPAGDAEGRTSWPVNLHLRADGFLPTHPLLPVRGASLDQDNVRTVVRAGGTFWKPWRQQKAGGGGGQSRQSRGRGSSRIHFLSEATSDPERGQEGILGKLRRTRTAGNPTGPGTSGHGAAAGNSVPGTVAGLCPPSPQPLVGGPASDEETETQERSRRWPGPTLSTSWLWCCLEPPSVQADTTSSVKCKICPCPEGGVAMVTVPFRASLWRRVMKYRSPKASLV